MLLPTYFPSLSIIRVLTLNEKFEIASVLLNSGGNMKRHFKDEILNPRQFVITLELIPGAESRGRSVDTVKSIAADAMTDGRVSAVTITDNPGGNPRLSPDVVGKEILELGMDVIVFVRRRIARRIQITIKINPAVLPLIFNSL